MKPASYRLQEGCETCPHVNRLENYDIPPCWYCTFGATPRPRHWLIEYDDTGATFDEMKFHVWEAWAEGREVSPRGICEHHPALKGTK